MQQIRITHPFDLLTMSLVTVFAAESPVESCKGKVYYMTLNDGTVACSDGWGTDQAKIEDGESATIVMLKDYNEQNSITFDKNIITDTSNLKTSDMTLEEIIEVETSRANIANNLRKELKAKRTFTIFYYF